MEQQSTANALRGWQGAMHDDAGGDAALEAKIRGGEVVTELFASFWEL